MEKHNKTAILLTRFALAAGFISAVCSRLGLWGTKSSGWSSFVAYTANVNSFLPTSLAPALAVMSTALELVLAVALLFGFKTRLAAIGTFILLMIFALAMAISLGIKEPLDYSVLPAASAALSLAIIKK